MAEGATSSTIYRDTVMKSFSHFFVCLFVIAVAGVERKNKLRV